MDRTKAYCYNCEAPADGDYCSSCGQRTSVHKVTFTETFQDFWDFLFSVNAPFFTTVKLLFGNPGKLLRDYLGGKRKRYYRPVAFFLLMTVVYLLIRSLIDFDPFRNSTIEVSDEHQSQLLTQARNFMLLNIDKLMFIFVFTLGGFMKLFFFRKRTFAEFLAVAFYFSAVYTMFMTLNMFVTKYITDQYQFVGLLVMMCYFCYAMVSFFQKKKLLVFIKAGMVYLFAFIFYTILAFTVSFLFIYLKEL